MNEYGVRVTIVVRAEDVDDAESLIACTIEELDWASDDGDDRGVVGYSIEEWIGDEGLAP